MRSSSFAWNIVGLGFPLLIAVVAIPILTKVVGYERFGLLSMAWALIGVAGMFDLGVGRAATHYIAEGSARGNGEQALSIIRTAQILSLIFGSGGTILVIAQVPLGTYLKIKLESVPLLEFELAILAVALAAPAQSLSALYRGINEAFGEFRSINLIRILMGVLMFAAPLGTALVSNNIALMGLSLTFSRYLGLYLNYRACRLIPDIARIKQTQTGDFNWETAKRLAKYGGWLTISSVINPVVTHFDKLFIGSIISASAVAAYSIPFDLLVQTLVIPGAVTTVLFPYLSQHLVCNREIAREKFRKFFFLTTAIMAIVSAACFVIVPHFLHIWIGESFPSAAKDVAKIVSLSLLPYTIGTLITCLVHAMKRPDVSAKSHLVQAPLIIFLQFNLVSQFGVVGAAYAWVAKTILDTLLLLAFSRGTALSWFLSIGRIK